MQFCCQATKVGQEFWSFVASTIGGDFSVFLMVWGVSYTCNVTDDVLNVCHFLLRLTEEAYPYKHQPFTSFVSKCVTLNLNKTGQCEQPPPFALCSLLLCEG